MPADTVDIDMHSVRADSPQPWRLIAAAIVDASRVAQLAHRVFAFVVGIRDADGTCADQSRDLPRRAADRSGGGSHHHRLAGLRLAEIHEPHITRESGCPKHPESRGN